MMPRMPRGADRSPLDFFALDCIKEARRRTPKGSYDTVQKLRATLLRAIEEQRAAHVWVRKVAKARRSVPQRLRRVSENGGKGIRGEPWRAAKKKGQWK